MGSPAKTLPPALPSKAEKSYWTIKEAARHIGVTPMTFYQWIKPGNYKNPSKILGDPPPVFEFGRNCVRIPIKEFIAWTENFRRS